MLRGGEAAGLLLVTVAKPDRRQDSRSEKYSFGLKIYLPLNRAGGCANTCQRSGRDLALHACGPVRRDDAEPGQKARKPPGWAAFQP
jgi:hypothetical protein